MAGIDDELRMDDAENAREIEFIRKQIPSELKDKFSDDELLCILDTTADYYFESGILEAQPDKDGYIDIDMEAVASHVCRTVKEEQGLEMDLSDVFFVVQADMDFQEQDDSIL